MCLRAARKGVGGGGGGAFFVLLSLRFEFFISKSRSSSGSSRAFTKSFYLKFHPIYVYVWSVLLTKLVQS